MTRQCCGNCKYAGRIDGRNEIIGCTLHKKLKNAESKCEFYTKLYTDEFIEITITI